jgi:hypothetical protein
MIMAANRETEAQQLSAWHADEEPSIERIMAIDSSDDRGADGPIRLLEVNSDTVAAGIMPVVFGANDDIHYKSIVVEVTPVEYARIEEGALPLPDGWILGKTLFERG